MSNDVDLDISDKEQDGTYTSGFFPIISSVFSSTIATLLTGILLLGLVGLYYINMLTETYFILISAGIYIIALIVFKHSDTGSLDTDIIQHTRALMTGGLSLFMLLVFYILYTSIEIIPESVFTGVFLFIGYFSSRVLYMANKEDRVDYNSIASKYWLLFGRIPFYMLLGLGVYRYILNGSFISTMTIFYVSVYTTFIAFFYGYVQHFMIPQSGSRVSRRKMHEIKAGNLVVKTEDEMRRDVLKELSENQETDLLDDDGEATTSNKPNKSSPSEEPQQDTTPEPPEENTPEDEPAIQIDSSSDLLDDIQDDSDQQQNNTQDKSTKQKINHIQNVIFRINKEIDKHSKVNESLHNIADDPTIDELNAIKNQSQDILETIKSKNINNKDLKYDIIDIQQEIEELKELI